VLTGLGGCAGERVVRRGASQQRVVSRTYPLELATFRERILEKFREVPDAAAPFRRMLVIELKAPNYPPDWVTSWLDAGNFLDPYKRISASDRAQDLLIEEPTGDRYWNSEYETAAGVVKFRCGFIVHLEQQGPRSTEVQVYEKAPEVWVGERWALLHHGIGIGRIHDIREAEPTVKDRLDLLNAFDKMP
jgi:hypothetical protein